MPKFIIRDEQGNTTLNLADRITKILGTISIPQTAGNALLPATADGTYFWFHINANPPYANQQTTLNPITISGNTITWGNGDGAPSFWPITIMYGIY